MSVSEPKTWSRSRWLRDTLLRWSNLRALSPRWPDLCFAAFESRPRMNSKQGSLPTSMTSTENPSFIPGLIRSIRLRDMSRSTETLY
jgi:hypothetical protein